MESFSYSFILVYQNNSYDVAHGPLVSYGTVFSIKVSYIYNDSQLDDRWIFLLLFAYQQFIETKYQYYSILCTFSNPFHFFFTCIYIIPLKRFSYIKLLSIWMNYSTIYTENEFWNWLQYTRTLSKSGIPDFLKVGQIRQEIKLIK